MRKILLSLLLLQSLTADILYVNPLGGSSPRNGSSWANGFPTLQEGLAAAEAGDQIYVAEGTYYPDQLAVNVGTNSRTESFALETGVEIYGGFPSPGGSTFAERDPVRYRTILSGDVTQDDLIDQELTTNSYHVLVADGNRPSGTGADGYLEGFTITGGYADSSTVSNGDIGGGLLIVNGAKPTLVNCFFERNFAADGGGAIAAIGSDFTSENCLFEQNTSNEDGGAIYASDNSSATISACTFRANQASNGGAIAAEESSPTLENCDFTGNVASNVGGALFNNDGSDSSLLNCTFQGNAAGNEGGAIFNLSSSPFIRNSIIWGNASDGDLATQDSSVGGTPDTVPFYFHSLVEGNDGSGSGSGNLNGKQASNAPRFLNEVNPLEAPTLRGDSRLLPGSPALDAGFNGLATTTDRMENTRIVNSTIDLGAFENQAFYYVRQDGASGNNSGTSWANAFFNLYEALAVAPSGAVVLVAKGVYLPEINTLNNLSSTFEFNSGVALLGGFPALGGETRDLVRNTTQLSGQIASLENAVSRIIRVEDVDAFTRIDGFLIGDLDNDHSSQPTSGGLLCIDSELTVSHCSFEGNDSNYSTGSLFANRGGAALSSNSCPRFFDCSFLANQASLGGAVYQMNGSARYYGCQFRGNTSRANGGALYSFFSDYLLKNCLFAGNLAGTTSVSLDNGPSIFLDTGDAEAINCSFFDSSKDGFEANCYLFQGNIRFDNCVNPTVEANFSPNVFFSQYLFNYCLVANPVSADARGGEGNFGTAQAIAATVWPEIESQYGDFRFLPDSPAFGSAADNFLLDHDVAGNPRQSQGLSDVGAYQEQGFHFVRSSATGANDGSSWTDAFTNLQDALSLATPGQVVLVAAGTYYPDQGSGQTDNARTSTFTLPSGVAVVGGFPAAGGSTPDSVLHPTILSGDLNQDGSPAGNSYHVVTSLLSESEQPVLRGFTIRDGYANGTNNHENQGAGLLCEELAEPRIIDCLFEENEASGSGGAVTNLTANPFFLNCTFQANISGMGGGAVSNENEADSIFYNCIFRGNIANTNGGGVQNLFCKPTYLSSLFSGNRATADGGGIFNLSACPLIENCTLYGNWAAGGEGGGLANQSFSKPRIQNCLIWGNAQELVIETEGASMAEDVNSSSIFISSLVYGFSNTVLDASDPESEGNFFSSTTTFNPNEPTFLDPSSPFNAPTTEGDYRLEEESFGLDEGMTPSISWCRDVLGSDRIQTESPNPSTVPEIDIGAFESGFPPLAGITFANLFPTLSPTEDENNNGLTNFEDYASGADPTVAADSAFLPNYDQSSSNLSFRYRKDAEDFVLIREQSPSLLANSWTTMVAGTHYTLVSRGDSGVFTFEEITPLSTEPKLFFRLRYAAP